MESYPSQEWLKRYEEVKGMLKPQSDLNEYFREGEICGKKTHLLDMGFVKFPTGNIMARDPLVYVSGDEKPYFIKVPAGTFPLTAAVVEVEEDHYRYAAVKVDINENRAEYFAEALIGNENLDGLEEGNYFGFGVDAGLGTIIDVKTRDAFCDFIEKWEKENPDKEIYNDLFAQEFEKSYEKNPQYQRRGGDWINFKIPETDLTIPMFQSGFGDGAYPVYFGYDKDDNICQIVILFIDIAFQFSDE